MKLIPTIKIESRFYAHNAVTKRYWDGKGFNAAAFGTKKKALTDTEAMFIKHVYENVELTRFDIEVAI